MAVFALIQGPQPPRIACRYSRRHIKGLGAFLLTHKHTYTHHAPPPPTYTHKRPSQRREVKEYRQADYANFFRITELRKRAIEVGAPRGLARLEMLPLAL